MFVDLAGTSITQVVFESDATDLFKQTSELNRGRVVSVTGVVRSGCPVRHAQTSPRQELQDGSEDAAHAERVPAAEVRRDQGAEEEAGERRPALGYRYIDLRRSLQRILVLRHRLCKVIRDHMDTNRFLEVETPLLGEDLPKGRTSSSCRAACSTENLALPQSPAVVQATADHAGSTTLQIARCLRDEDLRADRQPESRSSTWRCPG